MEDVIVARSGPSEDWDVVLIGGGIMSATLGVLLSEVQPDWRITVVERLDEAGLLPGKEVAAP